MLARSGHTTPYTFKVTLHFTMNFVPCDFRALPEKTLSPNTKQKTAIDVAHFKEFLVTIRSYQGAIEDLPEATLSDYLCEFLSGVKKRTDGTDYQPDSLWALYALSLIHI